MKKNLLTLLIAFATMKVAVGQSTAVFYHTNHFTAQYGTSGAVPNTDFSKIVVRFTPTIPYPCKLVKLKAWFRNCLNPSQFNWIAYADPTGAATGPGNSPTYFSSGGNYVNPAQGGVQDSAFADSIDLSSQNIILSSGDIYAGVTEHFQTNPFIGVAVDTANTSTPDREWVYSGAWYKAINWIFADATWGITAYFAPTAVGVNDINLISSSVEIYPQPASSTATLSYELKENSAVTISLYNTVGEQLDMKVIDKQDQPAGSYSVPFSVSELPAGIYFIRINTGVEQVTKKLVVVK